MHNVLKVAWANFGPVKQTELEEEIMVFEFENVKGRDRIMAISPWAIHGHALISEYVRQVSAWKTSTSPGWKLGYKYTVSVHI